MKVWTFFCLLFFFGQVNTSYAGNLNQDFDLSEYYGILKSGTLDQINKEIKVLEASNIPEKEAYTGTLLMKKAGLLKQGKQKLDTFKSGAAKLESAIKTDSANTEFHLVFATDDPGTCTDQITKYHSQIKNDSELVTRHHNKLSPFLQDIILNYSKTSKSLKPEDFYPKQL